jgi:predicted 3-demethylubiquinone-9 3-methyltransferase (glyoxalase superfamily)
LTTAALRTAEGSKAQAGWELHQTGGDPAQNFYVLCRRGRDAFVLGLGGQKPMKSTAKTYVQKIMPSLWYAKEAEEAARFYVSLFPDSRVDRVTTMQADSPSGPPGSVVVVEFTLFGQSFSAMTAGPHHEFNDAISFTVNCDSQAEIDRYWNAIEKNGGKPQACGWIIDKFGVRWQITPTKLSAMMADPDKAKAKRVAEEMMKQIKLDLPKLEAAFEGR